MRLLASIFLVLFAAAAPAHAQESAATTPPAALVPADALLVVEASDLAGTVRALMAGEAFARFRASSLWKDVQGQPQAAFALAGLKVVENVAGADALSLLDAASGGGGAFALLPGQVGGQPQTLAVLRALDPDLAQEAMQSLLGLAGDAVDLKGPAWRVPVGDAVLERRGSLFLLANVAEALDRVAATPTASIAGDRGYARARAATADAAVRIWVRGDLLRQSPDFRALPDEAGGSLLIAHAQQAVADADWAAGSIQLDAAGISVRAMVPAADSLAKSHAPFVPEPHVVAMPSPKGLLARGVLARDMGPWWTSRDLFMSERGVAGTIEADGTSSLLFQRDFGPEVLHWLEPELLFVVAELSDPPHLQAEFPAGAIGMRMRGGHPADLAQGITGAFLAIVTFINFDDAQTGRESLALDVDKLDDGTRIYFARYREWDGDDGAPPRHNLSPAMAVRPDGEIWIASADSLLREILAAPAQDWEVAGDRFEVTLAPARGLLMRNQEAIVGQRALQAGGDLEAAQAWFAQIAAGLELFDAGHLDLRLADGLLQFEARIAAVAHRKDDAIR